MSRDLFRIDKSKASKFDGIPEQLRFILPRAISEPVSDWATGRTPEDEATLIVSRRLFRQTCDKKTSERTENISSSHTVLKNVQIHCMVY